MIHNCSPDFIRDLPVLGLFFLFLFPFLLPFLPAPSPLFHEADLPLLCHSIVEIVHSIPVIQDFRVQRERASSHTPTLPAGAPESLTDTRDADGRHANLCIHHCLWISEEDLQHLLPLMNRTKRKRSGHS
ncbi:hypothetical protein DPX16_5514 [Anabarilius grahami]|uniref:Uncharacterized protein n=1 Tax=Anabarilius grahami TaxID=495550 RepID=A0A3N0Z3Y6_ANAGA|nr:hypothetical protein DPX16_5514 [Anabarilius grahami]